MFCNTQINPSSSDDWVLNNTKTKEAQVNENNQFVPIPSFSLGSNFNTKFVAIEVDVNNAKDHWSSAGYVYQQFDYPGLLVSNPTNFLKLTVPNLIELQINEDYQYELIYYPRKYFQSVTVKTWKYIGEVIDSDVNVDNSNLEQRLTELENKINLLL